ncbi:hypothetical protein JB92DRAFT_1796347 [Gautieria morchelliformis]|nr:hypothetical protein JB92DRAFT_1796347 [Gautieria morchelliformis]
MFQLGIPLCAAETPHPPPGVPAGAPGLPRVVYADAAPVRITPTHERHVDCDDAISPESQSTRTRIGSRLRLRLRANAIQRRQDDGEHVVCRPARPRQQWLTKRAGDCCQLAQLQAEAVPEEHRMRHRRATGCHPGRRLTRPARTLCACAPCQAVPERKDNRFIVPAKYLQYPSVPCLCSPLLTSLGGRGWSVGAASARKPKLHHTTPTYAKNKKVNKKSYRPSSTRHTLTTPYNTVFEPLISTYITPFPSKFQSLLASNMSEAETFAQSHMPFPSDSNKRPL